MEGCLMTPMRVLQQEGNVTDLRVEVGSFNRRAWLAVELMCWAEARGEREDTAGLRSFLAASAQAPLLGCSLDRQAQGPQCAGSSLQTVVLVTRENGTGTCDTLVWADMIAPRSCGWRHAQPSVCNQSWLGLARRLQGIFLVFGINKTALRVRTAASG